MNSTQFSISLQQLHSFAFCNCSILQFPQEHLFKKQHNYMHIHTLTCEQARSNKNYIMQNDRIYHEVAGSFPFKTKLELLLSFLIFFSPSQITCQPCFVCHWLIKICLNVTIVIYVVIVAIGIASSSLFLLSFSSSSTSYRLLGSTLL